MEALVQPLALWVSSLTEAVAAVVIAFAVAEAVVRTAATFLRHGTRAARAAHAYEAKEEVRLRLGRWLALSLEFLLAADILRIAVAPSWEEIGQLAAVAAIRTALNFFLQREIDAAERRRGGQVTAATSA